MSDGTDSSPVRVPMSELSPEALAGVIESFVLREGTDYGHAEPRLKDKVEAVRRQLERGDAEIFFDPDSGSVTIVPATQTGTAGRSTRPTD